VGACVLPLSFWLSLFSTYVSPLVSSSPLPSSSSCLTCFTASTATTTTFLCTDQSRAVPGAPFCISIGGKCLGPESRSHSSSARSGLYDVHMYTCGHALAHYNLCTSTCGHAIVCVYTRTTRLSMLVLPNEGMLHQRMALQAPLPFSSMHFLHHFLAYCPSLVYVCTFRFAPCSTCA